MQRLKTNVTHGMFVMCAYNIAQVLSNPQVAIEIMM